MEKFIQYLQQRYGAAINGIKPLGKGELEITIADHVKAEELSQNIQDHLVDNIDAFEIVKVNLKDANGKLIDSFSTTQ